MNKLNYKALVDIHDALKYAQGQISDSHIHVFAKHIGDYDEQMQVVSGLLYDVRDQIDIIDTNRALSLIAETITKSLADLEATSLASGLVDVIRLALANNKCIPLPVAADLRAMLDILGFHDIQRPDIIETNDETRADIEHVLQIEVTDDELFNIFNDWKAFYDNPLAYENSIVVDMVLQYLGK